MSPRNFARRGALPQDVALVQTIMLKLRQHRFRKYLVTRRVSEAATALRFFLAYAAGFQKIATSKRVSEAETALRFFLACASGFQKTAT